MVDPFLLPTVIIWVGQEFWQWKLLSNSLRAIYFFKKNTNCIAYILGGLLVQSKEELLRLILPVNTASQSKQEDLKK